LRLRQGRSSARRVARPAAGAGQIPKNLQVALGAGVPAAQAQPPVQVIAAHNIYLDSRLMAQYTDTQIAEAIEQLGNAWQQN
jgi:hypothetical protein